MPKANTTLHRGRVRYTEDLLSMRSKILSRYCPWPRDRTVRLPLERGGEVVVHCETLIIGQGGFKVLLCVPFPQPKGKLYQELIAEATPTTSGRLSWRLRCPKCGKEATYLYLVDKAVLCQACGKLKTRAPKPKAGGLTKRARMATLKKRIAELKAADGWDVRRPKVETDRAVSLEDQRQASP